MVQVELGELRLQEESVVRLGQEHHQEGKTVLLVKVEMAVFGKLHQAAAAAADITAVAAVQAAREGVGPVVTGTREDG